MTTQNLFTIVVEHNSHVNKVSHEVREVIAAIPGVIRVGILFPDEERSIAINCGDEHHTVMP